ncbi:MAG: 2,3-bisphosphoglycerate-independent phosphoglycerate mutase [Candidatus Falkowbacteria bacterium]
MKSKNPVILIIRDGWGYRKSDDKNYIRLANTPNEDQYEKLYPSTNIKCSGLEVGLLPGYQGNSEVGHMTIGSGRIIFQSLPRIHTDIKTGAFFKNAAFLKALDNCKKNKSALHLIGLLQTQGVHSHIEHLLALLDLCQKNNFKNVYVHAITDGRDAPTTESLKHLKKIQTKLKQLGFGEIATVSGRYYAMDRDTRWERTKAAYDAIALGQAEEYTNPEAAVKACHKNEIFDEFIKPMKAKNYAGIKKNDSVIFFNFRTDRTRQLTQAICEKKFTGFKRDYVPVVFVAMTQFYTPMNAAVAFPNISLDNLLGEVVAKANLKQLRISETEKYAHVTFFFNGQKEKANKGEERVLIKSPHVATYDLEPEMSVKKIAARIIKEIKKQDYDLIITNLVNCDMVGHTAKKSAILAAVEAVDKATGEIVAAAMKNNYTSILFADHGNAEDKSPKFMTSHTINPVPLFIVSPDPKLQKIKLHKGLGLKDVAPTVLKIMGLKKPKEMTGESLF